MSALQPWPVGLLLLLGGAAQAQVSAPTLTRAPAASSTDAFASFAFSAGPVQGYECAHNDGAYADCSSPHTLPALTRGSHRFAVRAVALDGQRSAATVHTWSVQSVFGTPNPDLIATTQQPSPAAPNSWRGIFRINCAFSHGAYDDPVVYPGQPYAAHQHSFYGFLGARYGTTVESMFAAEAIHAGSVSSCQGDRLNRSAYWVSTLLAPRYVNGARATDEHGQPAWQSVPAVAGNDDEAHEIFYYSAGIDDVAAIQSIPPGLKMIAGKASTGPASTPQAFTVARWHCQSWNSSDAGNPRWSATIPECVAPDRLRFDLFFPSCWNGRDLDSADHQSHLAYPVTTGQTTACPASHPVPIVRVSYHYAFGVRPENADPTSRSSRGWRLSSDMYAVSATQAGGLSLHGDWVNGWHVEVLQTVLDSCIKRRLDCHDGNLANGWRLSGTTTGTGREPAVIAEGLGPHHAGSHAMPTRGLWWDRARSGHGFDLQRVDDQYALAFYTYGSDGLSVWYLGTGPMRGTLFATELQRYDYASTRSPRQRPIAASASLATLRFDSAATHSACRDGVNRSDAVELAVLDLEIDGRRVSWCVEPLKFGQGAVQPDFNGLWYRPDDAGWGLTLGTSARPAGAVGVTVLYAYDSAGNGRWLLGSAEAATVGQLSTIELLGYRGACPGCPATPIVSSPAGSLRWQLSTSTGSNLITIDAVMPGDSTARWLRTQTPVVRLSH